MIFIKACQLAEAYSFYAYENLPHPAHRNHGGVSIVMTSGLHQRIGRVCGGGFDLFEVPRPGVRESEPTPKAAHSKTTSDQPATDDRP